MVFAEVSLCGCMHLQAVAPASIFMWLIPSGEKINATFYIRDVLEPVNKPLNNIPFKEVQEMLQHDTAPAHKVKMTEEWCKKEVQDFMKWLWSLPTGLLHMK